MALVDSAPDRCQHPRSRRAPSFPLGCRWGSRGISTESGHEPTAGPRTPTTGSQLTLTVRSHLFLPAKSSSRPRKSSNGPRGSGGPGEEEGNRVPESPPRTRALVRSARSPARALPMVALLGSSRGASASASAPARRRLEPPGGRGRGKARARRRRRSSSSRQAAWASSWQCTLLLPPGEPRAGPGAGEHSTPLAGTPPGPGKIASLRRSESSGPISVTPSPVPGRYC